MKKNNNIKKYLINLFGIIFLGFFTIGCSNSNQDSLGVGSAKEEIWTCSMHPQIKLPKPGKCPICGMDLIKVEETVESGSDPVLVLSDYAAKLAEVELTTVTRKAVSHELRMAGKIQVNETNTYNIASWVDGRIDKLYLDFAGTKVSKGDHLAMLYSPSLLIAQSELIEALAMQNQSKKESTFLQKSSENSLISSREKLRLLGFDENQIKQIEVSGKASDTMKISSPASGVVLHKNIREGQYVKVGQELFQIADLSKLWLMLDAYEHDLPWLRYGQRVEFETESYPGRKFHGKIVFIEPVVNSKTRVTKIRVNVENELMILKPDMLVTGTVFVDVTANGEAKMPEIKGKWISPMHPEIIKDSPGLCDICEMELVPVEKYFALQNKDTKEPLVIPKSAALLTGKRAIVYIYKGKGEYEGRVVLLGPQAGENYIVLKGLSVGDRIVSHAAFKIDSALQILAKESMMSEKHQVEAEPIVEDASINNAEKYFEMIKSLNKEFILLNESFMQSDKEKVLKQFQVVNEFILKSKESYPKLSLTLGGLYKVSEHFSHFDSNSTFDKLNIQYTNIVRAWAQFLSNKSFQVLQKDIYLFYCPMANESKGGYWFQGNEKIKNPYLKKDMLTCGELIPWSTAKAEMEDKK